MPRWCHSIIFFNEFLQVVRDFLCFLICCWLLMLQLNFYLHDIIVVCELIAEFLHCLLPVCYLVQFCQTLFWIVVACWYSLALLCRSFRLSISVIYIFHFSLRLLRFMREISPRFYWVFDSCFFLALLFVRSFECEWESDVFNKFGCLPIYFYCFCILILFVFFGFFLIGLLKFRSPYLFRCQFDCFLFVCSTVLGFSNLQTIAKCPVFLQLRRFCFPAEH